MVAIDTGIRVPQIIDGDRRVAHNRGKGGDGGFRARIRIKVASHNNPGVAGKVRLDKRRQVGGLRCAITGGGCEQVHTDNIEIVRARYIDLRPGETTIGDLCVSPRTAGDDRITADDPVWNVATGRVWFAKIDEVRPKG